MLEPLQIGLLILMIGLTIAILIIIAGLVNGELDIEDIFPNLSKDRREQKEWNVLSVRKPNSTGWYLCTLGGLGDRFTMLLYWTGNSFIDPVRKSVFDTYEVMVSKKIEDEQSIMPDSDEYMERIYTDSLCDRTEYVIAWKQEPRTYNGEYKSAKTSGMNRANGFNDDIVDKINSIGNPYPMSSEELKSAMENAKHMTIKED